MKNDSVIMTLVGDGKRYEVWAGFAAANPDIAADVAAQIAAHGYAYCGGGASPGVYVYPLTLPGETLPVVLEGEVYVGEAATIKTARDVADHWLRKTGEDRAWAILAVTVSAWVDESGDDDKPSAPAFIISLASNADDDAIDAGIDEEAERSHPCPPPLCDDADAE